MPFNTPNQFADPFIHLIENDKKIANSLKNQLVQEGVLNSHLSTCPSLSEAIQFLVENTNYEVILVSLSLPDGKGLSVVDRLIRNFPHKTIIVLATNEFKHLGQTVIRKGAQEFVLNEKLEEINLYLIIRMALERKKFFQQQMREELLAKSIQNNQQFYQSIFNKSKDAIYCCNLEGRLVDYNQATFELFAYSEEELMDIDVHDLFRSKDQKRAFLYALVTGKSISDFPIEIEQKNGKVRKCLISATMLQTEQFTGYSGIIRDITEQQKAEDLRKARDIARQSAKVKEEFIANISHEMRTPMNAILGMSNLLEQTKLDKEQYNYISTIKQSSEILLGVINDIVTISEIQNSKLKFNYQFFDLNELLQNLMNVLHFHANEKKLRLNLYLNENVPQIIHGDKLRLNQILYNLVVNAIKTTETGNINLTIENLNESREFVQLKFMIEDTSNGIPSDKIDAIFETFALIREKGIMREGIDVGLPIAKNLIEQQGGKINVISEIGKGSTFYFDLLFEIGEEAFSESLKAKANATLNKGPIKLLLVEDHLMNQVVAIKTLEKNWGNIEIILANDGQEAIQLLEKIDVDIILMDIQMPKMNGYETTSYIRRKLAPKKASLPIIAMTAHAHVAQGEKYKEYGMDDCIIKPFEPKELFRKITEHTFNHKILA